MDLFFNPFWNYLPDAFVWICFAFRSWMGYTNKDHAMFSRYNSLLILIICLIFLHYILLSKISPTYYTFVTLPLKTIHCIISFSFCLVAQETVVKRCNPTIWMWGQSHSLFKTNIDFGHYSKLFSLKLVSLCQLGNMLYFF